MSDAMMGRDMTAFIQLQAEDLATWMMRASVAEVRVETLEAHILGLMEALTELAVCPDISPRLRQVAADAIASTP